MPIFGVLMYCGHYVFISSKLEMDKVISIDFKVIIWFQRMHQVLIPLVAIDSHYLSPWLATDVSEADAITVDSYIVLVFGYIKAWYFRFPQLEWIMFIDNELLFRHEINHL